MPNALSQPPIKGLCHVGMPVSASPTRAQLHQQRTTAGSGGKEEAAISG